MTGRALRLSELCALRAANLVCNLSSVVPVRRCASGDPATPAERGPRRRVESAASVRPPAAGGVLSTRSPSRAASWADAAVRASAVRPRAVRIRARRASRAVLTGLLPRLRTRDRARCLLRSSPGFELGGWCCRPSEGATAQRARPFGRGRLGGGSGWSRGSRSRPASVTDPSLPIARRTAFARAWRERERRARGGSASAPPVRGSARSCVEGPRATRLDRVGPTSGRRRSGPVRRSEKPCGPGCGLRPARERALLVQARAGPDRNPGPEVQAEVHARSSSGRLLGIEGQKPPWPDGGRGRAPVSFSASRVAICGHRTGGRGRAPVGSRAWKVARCRARTGTRE
ncbi:MAG: hypothetical protein KatS3mg117_1622 [Geminicoccaceae bacterium]|nr:MAG: hypothetical protein KatS3mg117_1622 [Geminicoccaceae bacterium]